MALYFGRDRVSVVFAGVRCRSILCVVERIVNWVKLLSKDGYVLKDSNGLYLTAKESE